MPKHFDDSDLDNRTQYQKLQPIRYALGLFCGRVCRCCLDSIKRHWRAYLILVVAAALMISSGTRIHSLKQDLYLSRLQTRAVVDHERELCDIIRTIEIRYSWMSHWEAEFYGYWFRKWQQRSGRPWYLFCAVVRKESVFNPAAVSKANAQGLSQLMPDMFVEECRRMHIVIPSRDRGIHNVDVINLVCGMNLLVEQSNGLNLEQILRRYNSGYCDGSNAETDEYTIAVPDEMERLRIIYKGVQCESQLQDSLWRP